MCWRETASAPSKRARTTFSPCRFDFPIWRRCSLGTISSTTRSAAASRRVGDSRRATQLALQIAGQAVLYTTLMLGAGFFVFVFASMNNLFRFGLLTALAIVLALLADFLLAPALMQLIHGGQEREGAEFAQEG